KGPSDPPADRQDREAGHRTEPDHLRAVEAEGADRGRSGASRPTWRIGGGHWMKLTRLAGAAGIAIVALAAVGCNAGPGGGGSYKIGMDLPQQGSELAGSQPIINGALLALKQANGKAGSYTITAPKELSLDDALAGR